MKHRDIMLFLDAIDRQLALLGGFVRELSEQRPQYKAAFYALNRALKELDTCIREMRDAEPIEPAPRSPT